MTFRYYNGKKDDRECIDTLYHGGLCIAVMVNPDYTTDEILYDDTDYDSSARIGEPTIDATPETIAHVREKKYLGDSGIFAIKGDLIEVTDGKKYPKGMKAVVHDVQSFKWGYTNTITYLVFGGEGRLEKVQAHHTKIIGINGLYDKVKENITEIEVL